jgi:predicted alpha/beta superfamily hydrolase
MISGVSLGGYLAIEIFLKSPSSFAGLVTAQGAFGPNQAARYAAAAAAVPSIAEQRIEILTTSFDPYRTPNELFYKHLQKRGVASHLRVSPGPHDQRWLNESGVIEMLLAAQTVLQSKTEAAR